MPGNGPLPTVRRHRPAAALEEHIMGTSVPSRPIETDAASGALKLVELELALGAEDIRAEGFEASVRNACAASNVAFLFNLPVFGQDGAQRLAAAGWIGEDAKEPAFAFITLGRDGTTVRVDARCDCLVHAAGVARAWFDLMSR